MTVAVQYLDSWSARIGVAVCAAALVVLAGAVGSSAMAQDAAGPAAAGQTGGAPPAALLARMRRMRAAEIQTRLDQAASRLQITASEEPAWQAYTSAVKSFYSPQARPAARRGGARGAAPDAAAMLKRLADGAMTRAQRLAALADATGKLQAALSPNQQAVLDEIVRLQLRREIEMRGRVMAMRGRMRRGGFGMRGPMAGGGSGPGARVFLYRGRGGPDPGPGADQDHPGPQD